MAADLTPLRLLRLDGDGIGPEIMAATVAVLEAIAPRLSRRLELSKAKIGFDALHASGSTIPDPVIEVALAADGVLLGTVSHNAYPPREEGGLNPSGVLRKALDLFANIRPARSWAGLAQTRPVDLVIVRENLEGFYADCNMAEGPGEFSPVPGVALALRKITAEGSRRIARAGFEIAAARPAKRVTAVHKANVMRLTDGLFLSETRAVAQDFPEIAYDELLVDAAAAHLVRDPSRFDVIVTTNMFGDILSDLASELAGGLGLAGSLNRGTRGVAAQAQHGSAPDIAGQDRANPVSLIRSAAMLLQQPRAATAIDAGIASCLARPETRTRDLGGPLGTSAFTQSLIEHLRSQP